MSKSTLPFLALALVLLPGCGKVSKDTSKVLASVGGEKITQNDLETMVKAMVPDPSQAQKLMNSEGFRTQKAEFIQQLAMQKLVLAYARSQGLDQDPVVKVRVEGALAQAYYQSLLGKRAAAMPPTGAGPTDAQLQGMYDELKAKRPEFPPFEQIKAQLAQGYLQYQLEKDLKKAIPITFSDEVPEPKL